MIDVLKGILSKNPWAEVLKPQRDARGYGLL